MNKEKFVGGFVEQELYDALVCEARAQQRSVSGEMRMALEKHLRDRLIEARR